MLDILPEDHERYQSALRVRCKRVVWSILSCRQRGPVRGSESLGLELGSGGGAYSSGLGGGPPFRCNSTGGLAVDCQDVEPIEAGPTKLDFGAALNCTPKLRQRK